MLRHCSCPLFTPLTIWRHSLPFRQRIIFHTPALVIENMMWTGGSRPELSSQAHSMILSFKQEVCFPRGWSWFLPPHVLWWQLPRLFPLWRHSRFCSVHYQCLGNSKSSQNFCIGWTAQCAAGLTVPLTLRAGRFFWCFFQHKSYKSIISLSCYHILSSTLTSETVMAKKIYFTILFIPLLLHNYSLGSTSGSHPRSFYV